MFNYSVVSELLDINLVAWRFFVKTIGVVILFFHLKNIVKNASNLLV